MELLCSTVTLKKEPADVMVLCIELTLDHCSNHSARDFSRDLIIT